jgi:PiT family inorganic phosphate transporter
VLIAIFAIVGSMVEGPKLYPGYKFADAREDLGESAKLNLAFVCTFAAALTVLGLTYLGLPVSCSQAAVGGLMGVAILSRGIGGAQWGKLGVWACCWVLNPIGAGIVAYAVVKIIGPLLNRFVRRVALLNLIYKIGLIIFGCYGAYSLGANNVVVSTGPFYQAGFFGDPSLHKAAVIAAGIGGASIALGALTYSKKVMMTVGQGITALDPFSALVAVLAHSIAMHFFTELHVPVSSSQAIVGAVAGVGLTKGMRTMNRKTLWTIFSAWLLTPFIAGTAAVFIAYVMGVRG